MSKPAKTICYRGFLGGPRSMGKVGSYLVKHLLRRPDRYRVHFYPWNDDFMDGYWDDAIAAVVTRDPSGLDIDQTISFCSVLDARQDHFAETTTPWFYYELSSLPEEIATQVNGNDHVYLTSAFVQRVFTEHGVRVPTSVLGHGVDPDWYRFMDRSVRGPFVFLCVAENTTRKNLRMLLRAFEHAFATDPDVRLVLKLGIHGDVDLAQCITQPRKITLLTKLFLDEAPMVDLYRQAHCFVLPTRAEGFGMPILEAMATGLPVIVTGYGGHLDFCTEQNSYLIRNKGLVDSDPACFPHIRSQWADPDEEHLIHLMREVHGNYAQALKVGARAAQAVAENWTWDKQLSRAFP